MAILEHDSSLNSTSHSRPHLRLIESDRPKPNFNIWEVTEELTNEDWEFARFLTPGERESLRTSYYISIDGEEALTFDPVFDGEVGYVDGLDREPELAEKGILDLAWLAIADYMRNKSRVLNVIVNPDGNLI